MFEWIIRLLRKDWDETAGWPLAAQRAVVASRPYPNAFGKRVSVRHEALGGVPAVIFTPRPRAQSPDNGLPPRIVYFHGGSYVYGSCTTSHAEICAHLALATSLEVVGVEYRLAPEHVWPAQLEDALAACRALDGAPIILAGDSAGGHLAVKVAHAISAKALVLLSPWTDLEMPGRSFSENAVYDLGDRPVLLRHARAVAGSASLASLALRNEPLAALPRTWISVGEVELPRDDILVFADGVRAAGVDCSVHVAPDMPHNPALFESYHPAGKEAFAAIVTFIESVTR